MEILFLRQAHKFIQRADPPLKEKIRKEVLAIANNPRLGKLLKGRLSSLRSHRFVFVGTHYRIAYRHQENLLIVTVATRENFYRDLRI